MEKCVVCIIWLAWAWNNFRVCVWLCVCVRACRRVCVCVCVCVTCLCVSVCVLNRCRVRSSLGLEQPLLSATHF